MFAMAQLDEVLAQIVTASQHVVGYSIDLKTLNATELWRVPVKLYGPVASRTVSDSYDLLFTRFATICRDAHYASPITWPASIAVNKKYMLVAKTYQMQAVLTLLAVRQVQSDYLEAFEFKDGPGAKPVKITPPGTPDWYSENKGKQGNKIRGRAEQGYVTYDTLDPPPIGRKVAGPDMFVGVGQVVFGNVAEDVAYSITAWGRVFKIELPSLKATLLIQHDASKFSSNAEYAITAVQFQLPDRIQTRVYVGTAGTLASHIPVQRHY